MSDHGGEFIGLVANAMVMRDRDPLTLPYDFEPLLVRGVVFEVVAVPLDVQSSCAEDLGEPDAEIAVGEEDMGQAACS